jgi:KDO2-lipid IV(A) lauroyltransferase
MDRGKVSKSSPVVAGTLKGLVRGVAWLPLPVARATGRVVGALLWHLPNQFRAASVRNIARCFPDLEESQRRQLVRRSLASTGMTAAEAGAMFHWSRQRLMALESELVGAEIMDAALARGKGVVALGPHLGNWEYLSHVVGWRWGMLALYRPPRIAQLDRYLRHSREHLGGTRLAPADSSGLRQAARTLKGGGIVGILPDQEPLKKNGIFAPFFGIPALTMTLVGRLTRRFDAAVVYGFAERLNSGGFRVQLLEAPEGLGDADPLVAATSLNFGVERCVRQLPEQYTWSYRRFRTRSPEELAARDAGRAEGMPPTASR